MKTSLTKTDMNKKRLMKFGIAATVIILAFTLFMLLPNMTAHAANGSALYNAIYSTWTTAQTQIKKIVNNVVFPVVDCVLAILFFVKLGTAYFDYKKHGQFELTAPAILFACLLFTIIAPSFIWDVLGWA